MDKRILVEKKADFQVKSESLVRELQHNLGLSSLKSIRIVQVYDVFDLAEDLFEPAEKHIFSEQVTDHVLDEAAVQADLANYAFFAIESLPGQFDQRAASSQEALLLLGSSNDVTVNTAQLYLVNKILMRLSWKRSRTICSTQLILVSRTSRQGLPSRNFQSQTRPFLN